MRFFLNLKVSNLQVGTEAAFHGVEEYMKHVEEYFQEIEVRQGYPVETKQVYIATDEPKVRKLTNHISDSGTTISENLGYIFHAYMAAPNPKSSDL